MNYGRHHYTMENNILSILPHELVYYLSTVIARVESPLVYSRWRVCCKAMYMIAPHYLSLVRDTHVFVMVVLDDIGEVIASIGRQHWYSTNISNMCGRTGITRAVLAKVEDVSSYIRTLEPVDHLEIIITRIRRTHIGGRKQPTFAHLCAGNVVYSKRPYDGRGPVYCSKQRAIYDGMIIIVGAPIVFDFIVRWGAGGKLCYNGDGNFRGSPVHGNTDIDRKIMLHCGWFPIIDHIV